jgi:hypothetical protein
VRCVLQGRVGRGRGRELWAVDCGLWTVGCGLCGLWTGTAAGGALERVCDLASCRAVQATAMGKEPVQKAVRRWLWRAGAGRL